MAVYSEHLWRELHVNKEIFLKAMGPSNPSEQAIIEFLNRVSNLKYEQRLLLVIHTYASELT